MEVPYGYKKIHTGGDQKSKGKPVHAARNRESYMLAFKEAFWALSVRGYTGPTAFRKLDYNAEMLGLERIHNTTKRLRQAGSSAAGFCDGNRGGLRIKGRAAGRFSQRS